MSKVISGVTGKLGALEKVTKSAGDFASGLGIQMGGLTNPAMLAGQAILKMADFTKKAIDETVDYTKQVRDLAANLNITTEETSRLIQTADDYGISTQSMTTAMEMALKNGFAPTIESLAQAADQYLAIQDPTERAAALTKIYGRNWAELTPMLKEGGKAIRDAAAAQADNLIVTEEAAQAARDYEIAMDTLEDKIQGVKYELGNNLLPVLVSVAKQMEKTDQNQRNVTKAFEYGLIAESEYEAMSGTLMITQAQLNERLAEYEEQANATYDIEVLRAKQSLPDVAAATEEAYDPTKDLASAMWDSAEAGGDAAAAMERLTTKNQLYFDGINTNLDSTIAGWLEKIEFVKAGGLELQKQFDLVNEEYINGNKTLLQTQREMELIAIKAEVIKVKMGEITAEQAAENIANTLGVSLADALSLVNQIRANAEFSVTSYVHIITTEERRDSYGGGSAAAGNRIPEDDVEEGPGGANGLDMIVPPGYPNDTYPIRASSGERVTITNNFSMTVHSNASTSTLQNDFALMRSRTGAR